jgi:hypothetical protein
LGREEYLFSTHCGHWDAKSNVVSADVHVLTVVHRANWPIGRRYRLRRLVLRRGVYSNDENDRNRDRYENSECKTTFSVRGLGEKRGTPRA